MVLCLDSEPTYLVSYERRQLRYYSFRTRQRRYDFNLLERHQPVSEGTTPYSESSATFLHSNSLPSILTSLFSFFTPALHSHTLHLTHSLNCFPFLYSESIGTSPYEWGVGARLRREIFHHFLLFSSTTDIPHNITSITTPSIISPSCFPVISVQF
jgi:hypothetical protein